jgi:hypothetical protein
MGRALAKPVTLIVIKTLMVFAALYPFYELSRKDWAKLTSSVEFKSEIATKER